MVFDPGAAPIDREAFLAWYNSHSDEDEIFNPTRSDFSTPQLRLWLEEILETFPAMNGPFATIDSDVDDPHLTDYGIGRTHIYACFSWSLAESAYKLVMALAEKYGIAVFDVSNPHGRIWRPGTDGTLQ